MYKIARTICNGDQERSKKKQKMAKCDNVIICDFKMSLLTDMLGQIFKQKFINLHCLVKLVLVLNIMFFMDH